MGAGRSVTGPRIIGAAVLVVAAFWLVGCGEDGSSSSSSTTTAGGDGEATSVLASISAGGGTWGDVDADGTRVLELVDADDHVVVFADRPSRRAGVASTSDLVDQWDQLFGDDPPNAVIVEHEPSGDQDSTVVTLTDPDYDVGSGSLRFSAVVLEEEDQPGSSAGVGGERHAEPPSEFGAGTVFIDDFDFPFNVLLPLLGPFGQARDG